MTISGGPVSGEWSPAVIRYVTGRSAMRPSASAAVVVRGSDSRFSPSRISSNRARFASLLTCTSPRWLPSSVSPSSPKSTRGDAAASTSK